jgi:cytochrome c biogenesis protein ResB
MIVAIKNIWDFFGSLTLSVWILLAVAFDAVIGSAIIQIYRPIFSPLNHLMLPDWIANYELKNLSIAWWVFVFLLLLFLLGINIFVCTTNRIMALIRQKSSFMKFAPHIIHYAFIMLLLGHLTSYLVGFISFDNPIEEGETILVPHSNLRIKLEDLSIEYEKSKAVALKAGSKISSMKGGPRKVSASLGFIGSDNNIEKKEIAILRPIWYQGFSFHIRDFYPKREGISGKPHLSLIIRRDPGLKILLTLLFNPCFYLKGGMT